MKHICAPLLKHQLRLLVLALAVSALFGAFVVYAFAYRDPACVRSEAKLALAGEFCAEFASQISTQQCSGLSDPEFAGECKGIVTSLATESCVAYVGVPRLEAQKAAACE